MDRITRKVGDGVVFPSELVGICMAPDSPTMYKILTRLAEYEDTGLTPDEVEYLKVFEMAKAVAEITEFDGVPIQRLKELATADKTGNVDIVRHESWEEYTTSRFFGFDEFGDPIYRNGVVYYCTNPRCRRKTVVKESYCPNCGARMDGDEENEA